MDEVAIFLYGLVVFAIVGAACGLIGWGVVAERRDHLEKDATAEAAGGNDAETATDVRGDTVITGRTSPGRVR